ncbi:uncharacterized protein LOC133832214 [Humulus lupulus]|uniref:uncharacterized protein LOC133832214 n=1 Tax=Humulus lupulus TaxID=3486 RepID=UPI002B412B32|nr:uncharacterized protein LOC133832214 [Humulus lupulus]
MTLNSNSYNPSWRQHPNFSWSNQGAGPSNSSMPPRPNFPPGYPPQAPQQRPQQQAMQSSSLENMLTEYIVKNEAMIQSQAASLRNLENQVGQLANELRNRPHGSLPSEPRIQEMGARNINAVGMPQHQHPGSSISKQPPPFPQRFQKKKLDSQFKKFLDMLKQLHINIPLEKALEQMSNYVKFMKDVLTRKRRLGEFETVALTKECSSFLQNKLPPKMKDPGSFVIPCTIDGKIEDVLVKVDKFIFPADFIVLDYEADREIPIILGRPFLTTGRTLIDVQKGELTMRVQDEQVTFNVFKAMRFPYEIEECSTVSVVDSLASREFETSNIDDPLEREFKAPKPSIEEEPELELKVLPSHLRYAYLGPSSTLPVIISAQLSHDKEEKLLKVLRKFKKAIGWTIADI